MAGADSAGRWTLCRRSSGCACSIRNRRAASSSKGSAIYRAFPAFAEAKIAGSWAGLMDVTPDAVPVISDVASIPGFFIASGFSGHGFGIGPGAGQLMADLLMNATPLVDPAPYRLSRFRTRPSASTARHSDIGHPARNSRRFALRLRVTTHTRRVALRLTARTGMRSFSTVFGDRGEVAKTEAADA